MRNSASLGLGRSYIKEVEIPSDADAERIHVFPPDEEAEYFRRASEYPDLHDVCRLMINQGVGPEEATSLAKGDVDFEKGRIHISRGKTKSARRFLDMTTESLEILKRRMDGPSRWIFPSKRKPGSHIDRIKLCGCG